MNNKKVLIISLVAILVFATLAVFVASPVFAATDPGKITPKDFNNQNANNLVGKILGFVQWIGSALAIVMIVIIGIKYMAGSAEEKAEYKKTMIPYIVGAILIFAASNIASWVYNAVTAA